MDMSTQFPSPWFAASDFDAVGKEMTIGNVMLQQVFAEFKPVVFFNGQEKAMVLNPTNNKILMGFFGKDSKDWTGKRIVLFSFTAMFQGQPQLRLGVRLPDGHAQPAAPAQVTNYAALKDEMNDDIPI
jgi:hypothetical protein